MRAQRAPPGPAAAGCGVTLALAALAVVLALGGIIGTAPPVLPGPPLVPGTALELSMVAVTAAAFPLGQLLHLPLTDQIGRTYNPKLILRLNLKRRPS